LITSHVFDLEVGRARENALFLHIGRMTVKAAAIDEAATVVLARLLAPADEAVAIAVLGPEMFGTKRRYLDRALPEDWADRKSLIRAMQRVEEYRNALAHSTIHTIYRLTEQSESTRLHSTKGGWSDPDPEEFVRWEARSEVTYALLWQLGNDNEPDVRRHDARALVLWHYGDTPLPAITEALNELFPGENRERQ
jgi:hypothetical protein